MLLSKRKLFKYRSEPRNYIKESTYICKITANLFGQLAFLNSEYKKRMSRKIKKLQSL